MSPKLALTDRKLKSLKPAKERYEIRDSVVPGLSVRVGARGRVTFVLNTRFGGSPNPARRTIGVYGAISLEQARARARDWLELIRKGIDPRVAEERARQAELRKQGETFGQVAEAYIQHIDHHRTARAAAGTIRRELRQWWQRPASDISRRDVIALVQSIAKRNKPYQAHLTFGHVRAVFNWALATDAFGLEFSPADRIKPRDIIVPKRPRQRVLNDNEIVALWNATEKLGGPFSALYRLLLLTGCRRSELAEAKWSEIDLAKGVFVVPAERFKSGVSHLVPLSAQAVSILETLPRYAGGDFVFSNSLGKQPVGNFSANKLLVDELMAKELGEAPASWVIHDLRRTMRTRLASLQVPDVVAEAIVGHGRKGIQRVCDQHSYEPEMRAALERWALRLRSIISPLSTTILSFPSIA
jgi:integrase